MKKIMVVDDEQVMLTLATQILGKYYEVVLATSGEEALQKYEKELPDLILLDVYMPDMSGYETLYILRERFGHNIKVIFVTADERVEGESEGFERGAVDYIRKPFLADVLLRRIEIVFQNQEEIKDLEEVAGKDPMTGFWNQVSSAQMISSACCHGESGMLLLLDLDNLKLVNDEYGHHIGDQVLIRFSLLLLKMTRQTDIVGRVGGDKFVVFFRTPPSAEMIGERCKFLNDELKNILIELLGDDGGIPIGCSIGAVTAPEEGVDFRTLYDKANKVLLTVKQTGKHNFGFYGASMSLSGQHQAAKDSSLSIIAEEYGEGDKVSGAMKADADTFPTIFRLLRRISDQYGKSVQILSLSLEKEGGPDEGLLAHFLDFLASHLRRSDIVMHYKDNLFLIVLPDTASAGSKFMIKRIQSGWDKHAENGGSTFKLESADIREI